MTNSPLLDKAEIVASKILLDELPKELSYHNYENARELVQMVNEIGVAEGMTEQQLEIVLIAAWFQYTGFKDNYTEHEQASRQITEAFLKEENVPFEKTELILSCVHSTHPKHVPNNQLEEVLVDALNTRYVKGFFKKYLKEYRNELAHFKKEEYTDIEWLEKNLEEIYRIKFLTKYGKEVLSEKKEENRVRLEKNASKLQKKIDENLVSQLGVTPSELKSLKKKLQKAKGRPERGIETMFRLTSKNHIDLSSMADTKANIMISVNSIILSILIGGLMQKLDTNPHLVVPTITLLAVNLATMIFAILSIRPNITNGLFTRDDIENHRTNLLFFGNFHKMKREDYHWGMNRLMENSNFLYSNLIDDVYFLGVVLARKYRLLRWSYNIFMYGIVTAVIAYIIANFLANQPVEIDVLLDDK